MQSDYSIIDRMVNNNLKIAMIDHLSEKRVKELTKGKQTPATAKPQTIPDFPLVLKK